MQIYKKDKIFHYLRSILWRLFKLFVTVLFIIFALPNSLTLLTSPYFLSKDGSTSAIVIEIVYLWLNVVLSVYMVVWTILGLKKENYPIFAAYLIVFIILYFLPPVQLTQRAESCLSNGHVWDGDLQQCRDDCLTWNEKDGRVPL